MSKEDNSYYVYELVDPRTQEPFYIGKGKADRMHYHLKFVDDYNPSKQKKIAEIRQSGNEPIARKIYTNLSNDDALIDEKILIAYYGIEFNGGLLTNMTYGGDGGDTSMWFTDKSIAKIKASSDGVNNAMSKLTEEQVLEIYYAEKTIKELSDEYKVCTTQIQGIKRKDYYKTLTKDIKTLPGFKSSGKGSRQIIPIDFIEHIYLEEGSYKHFRDKYGISKGVLTSIKTRKTYRKYTQHLGEPGRIFKGNRWHF